MEDKNYSRVRWTWTSYEDQPPNYDSEFMRYLCYQREACPKTGKLHWQGYLECQTKKRFQQVKKLLGDPSIHLEPSRGDAEDNREYCSKCETSIEGSFCEFGEAKKKGARSDLDAVAEEIKGGNSLISIATNHPVEYIKFGKGIENLYNLIHPQTEIPTYNIDSFPWVKIEDFSKTIVLVGKEGIGKTEFAKAHFPSGCLFVEDLDQLSTFDPRIHEGIVFDDMSYNYLPRSTQIYLVDTDNGRHIHIRYKTAFIPAHVKKIMTTNKNPWEIFEKDPNDNKAVDKAIARRINVRILRTE